MSPAIRLAGALFVALGVAIASFKVVRHGIPLAPTDEHGPWEIELRVSARGDGERGSVRAMLPSTEPGQTVFDERTTGERLTFAIQEGGDGRVGVWAGRLEGVHELVYRFRVQSTGLDTPIVEVPTASEPPPKERDLYLRASVTFPVSAPAVAQQIERFDLAPASDPAARIQTVFSFVAHEVQTVDSGGDDALLTLESREGSALGKERLLVTLLRAAGSRARLAQGLELREGTVPVPRTWVEVGLGGSWITLSAAEGVLGRRPESWVVLGRGTRALVEATGVRAVGHRFRAQREPLRPDEIASLMAPDDPVLSWLSLYRLPIGTQNMLRWLLLFPLGAVVIAIFRNVVGVRTYGTFMPALIALALHDLPLLWAAGLLGGVLGIGVVTRIALERLRLLMVPRLSILVCVVVFCVTAVALINQQLGGRDWLSGTVLPIVILTMWIERITITTEEEGPIEAMKRALWSLVVAAAVLPIFQSQRAGYLMFTFPELTFCAVGVLIWIGGYTGYRVVELLRFRSLAQEAIP
ncbi:MAG TPA: UUP1 family membrane protein [Myxococcota bacterium]|nr:UUP1 family membrane protein [Myxococcota bacterium]